MKKFIVLSVALIGALSLVACAGVKAKVKTTDDGRAVDGGMPQFVKNALSSVPKDTLCGVGSAKIGAAGLGQARTIATARARAEIGRTLSVISKDSITDFTASNEVDPEAALAYQETVNIQLSKADLTGASIIEQDQDASGNYWVVVTLGKTDAVKAIATAQAAARLADPQAKAFDALDRMEAQFDKVAAQEAAAR